MVPPSKQNRGALLALFFTILLLTVTSWNLYYDFPTAIIAQSNSSVHNLVPTNQQDLSALRAAAILETRPLENLIPLILHFSVILGPGWPIHVFTSLANTEAFHNSSALTRLVRSGGVVLRELPKGVPDDFAFHETYKFSSFLTQNWFWEHMAPAMYVLLFSADSILCSRADKSLDDFLGYDLIIPQTVEGRYVRSGMSLRKRETMLKLIKELDWNAERLGNTDLEEKRKVNSEALWVWRKLQEDSESGDKKVKLPTKGLMSSYAMNDVWEDRPIGYAHVKNQHDRLDEIMRWCPEYSLAMTDEQRDDQE